jgi:hypothetical protein
MTDFGKVLIALGLVILVAGVLLSVMGRANLHFRATAGRFCVSREEHNVLFSAGDFGGGERGAFDSAVCGGAVEEVTRNLRLVEPDVFGRFIQLTSA